MKGLILIAWRKADKKEKTPHFEVYNTCIYKLLKHLKEKKTCKNKLQQIHIYYLSVADIDWVGGSSSKMVAVGLFLILTGVHSSSFQLDWFQRMEV